MRVMSLLPIFVKVEGERVLVVGGGALAESKVALLREAGAELCVVSPTATARIAEWSRRGQLCWHARPVEPGDIGGSRLVFAATGVAAVDREVARQCRERGILCNAIDDPDFCDFYSPAVVRRGDLQIAISTSGRSPALAQQIREQLERQFDGDWVQRVDDLGTQRKALLATMPRGDRRTLILRSLANAALVAAFGEHNQPGKVYFVGSGPGAADLLTVRALQVLQQADVVLHDELVPDEIKRLAPVDALLLNVGRRCGQPEVPREVICALLVSHARAGRAVARLKCGDPSMFARLGEEMEALERSGIAFEIIPGVTAAVAAAAAAQISLTDRRLASHVVFTTASLSGGQLQSWRGALIENATLVIYMPGRDFGSLAARLAAAGAGAQVPCVVISSVSGPGEEVCAMPLGELAQFQPRCSPAIAIVGEVARGICDARPAPAFAAPDRACATV